MDGRLDTEDTEENFMQLLKQYDTNEDLPIDEFVNKCKGYC